ncbi:MAG: hypothetical protein D6689_12730 [Deltaproteobacteria bacterium]|nr:MAG: hypothetical protein D6689_12730 [Deltaproteobacteria bacterium]
MDRDLRRRLGAFEIGLAVAASAVGALFARSGVERGAPAFLYAVPVAIALAAVWLLRRRPEERTIPSSKRVYTLYVREFTDAPVADLAARVEAYGYQLAVADRSAGDARAPGDAAHLGGCALRVRDRRAPPSWGGIDLSVERRTGGTAFVTLEAVDTEPGFYDELAQYVVAAMGELWPESEYTHTATDARRPPAALRDELPARPLGLALVDDAAASSA